MTTLLQRRIDCHVHVFDPARFPYAANTFYRPSGGETGSTADLSQLAETGHACVNHSGYTKFAAQIYPYADVQPFVQALLEAWLPDPAARQAVWWETPRHLLGWEKGLEKPDMPSGPMKTSTRS